MVLKLVLAIISIIICKVSAKHVASDFAVPKECNEIQPLRTQTYVAYYDDVSNGNEGYTIGKSKPRMKYRYENIEINQTKAVCCDGYQNYNEQLCTPVCTKSCGSEGICSSPENCLCNEGYHFDLTSQKCEPICSSKCINGFCMSPDLCTCYEGYRMADDNHTCNPICQINGTDTCRDLEFCTEPGVCRCISGYVRKSMDRLLGSDEFEMCEPLCERTCINGKCISPNFCLCHQNYTRVDEFTCEHIYFASNFVIPKNCSETKIVKEKQHIPYQETYIDGYENNDDDEYYNEDYGSIERKTKPIYKTRTSYRTEYVIVNKTKSICCDGYQNYDDENCLPVCSKSCGPHGICSKPGICICNEGYSLDYLGNCIPVCQSECINGQCTSPNFCSCNEGYRKTLDDYTCELIYTADRID